MVFTNKIDNLYNNIKDYIDRYISLEGLEPLTDLDIKNIINIFQSLHRSLLLHDNELQTEIDNYHKRQEFIVNEYNQELEGQTDALLEARKQADNKNKEISLNTIERKKERRKIFDEQKIIHQNWIKNYVNVSNQNIKAFNQELDENINRYDHELLSAQNSFNEGVIEYCTKLQQELNAANEKNEKTFQYYDNECRSIISSYKDKIDKLTVLENQANERLKSFESKVSDLNKSQIIESNGLIRNSSDELKRDIKRIRDKYQSAIAELNIKKNNELSKHRESSNEIFKVYINKIAQIDKSLIPFKEVYEDLLYKHVTNSAVLRYNLKTRFNNSYKMLIKHKNEYTDKQYKRQLKKLKKYFNKEEALLDRKIQEERNAIERRYKIVLENLNSQKREAEIDRNLAIKLLPLEEKKINDHYADLIQKKEYEMQRDIANTRVDSNISATTMRHNSQLLQLKAKRVFDIESVRLNIEIDKATYNKSQMEIEYDYTLKLTKNIMEHEKLVSERENKYITVKNMLEIELLRVLNDYNQKCYDLNVLYQRELYQTEYLKTKLKGLLTSKLKNEEIALDEMLTSQFFSMLDERSETDILKNQIDVSNKENKYNAESRKANISLIHSLNQLDIKFINSLHVKFDSIIDEATKSFIKLNEIIIASKIYTDHDADKILTFYLGLKNIIIEFYSSTIEAFSKNIEEIADNRRSIDSNHVFKKIFSRYEGTYGSRKSGIDESIESIKYEIQIRKRVLKRFYKEETEANRTLHALKNKTRYERLLSKDQITKKELHRAEIADNIKKTKNEINQLNKRRDMITSNFEKTRAVYIRKTQEIKKASASTITLYDELRETLNQINQKSKTLAIRKLGEDIKITAITSTDYFKDINIRLIEMYRSISATIQDAISKYKTAEELNHILACKSLERSVYSITRELALENKKLLDDNIERHNMIMTSWKTKIEKKRSDIENLKHKNALEINKQDLENKKALDKIRNLMTTAQADFRLAHYSVQSNLTDVHKTYESDIIELKNNYNETTQTLTTKAMKDSQDLLKEFNNKLAHKNTTITDHIPDDSNDRINERILEFKELQRNLDNELFDIESDFTTKCIDLDKASIAQGVEHEGNIISLKLENKKAKFEERHLSDSRKRSIRREFKIYR